MEQVKNYGLLALFVGFIAFLANVTTILNWIYGSLNDIKEKIEIQKIATETEKNSNVDTDIFLEKIIKESDSIRVCINPMTNRSHSFRMEDIILEQLYHIDENVKIRFYSDNPSRFDTNLKQTRTFFPKIYINYTYRSPAELDTSVAHQRSILHEEAVIIDTYTNFLELNMSIYVSGTKKILSKSYTLYGIGLDSLEANKNLYLKIKENLFTF